MKNQLTVLRYWVEAHRALGQRPTFELLSVFRHYRETHRRYHAIGHIAACLRVLELYRDRLSKLEFAMLVLALIYHDVIYDVVPGAKNEKNSAHLWVGYADEREFDLYVLQTVSRLILLTARHTFEPCGCGDILDKLGPIMIDIDMHVLALPWHPPAGERYTPWTCYWEYARAVRQEYGAYKLQDYVAGRLHFLSTVDPQATFYTPEMQGSWTRVRENIQEEKLFLENTPEQFFEEWA
jgi:predicted metal-dependent HD superfamily phosphohydrolase